MHGSMLQLKCKGTCACVHSAFVHTRNGIENVCTALEREHNFQCIATCAICMCVYVVLHVHLQFAVEHANLITECQTSTIVTVVCVG